MNSMETQSPLTVDSAAPIGPDFLQLPWRDVKPRAQGITHVLDKGIPIPSLEALLLQQASLIDILKIGWGTAYIDPSIKERVALCRAIGVSVCLGGTLLEVCVVQNRVNDLCRWASEIGVEMLEVSNGLQMMDRNRKTQLIHNLSQHFKVLAETGSKSNDIPVVPAEWVRELHSDLDAGASLVIAEGRESGTVGLYDDNGAVRSDLVDIIADTVPLQKIIFEAPLKQQQVWLIQRFGTAVNLGNVPLDEVTPLETSRLGLRADTASLLSVSTERPQ